MSKKQKRSPQAQIRACFANQRCSARKRKDFMGNSIEWKLTYEQWLSIWGEQLKERGKKAHQKVMARIDDLGNYEVGNVRIITARENHLERAARMNADGSYFAIAARRKAFNAKVKDRT